MRQEELDLTAHGDDPGAQASPVGSYARAVQDTIAALEPMAQLNSKAVVATALAEAGRHFGVKLQEIPKKPKGAGR